MAGPGKGGRKSKLTPELIEKISQLIQLGNYVKVACAACGISETTYFNWVRDAQRLIEQYGDDPDKWPDELPEHDARLLQFLLSVERADAEAEAYAVGMMRQAMPKHWQAAATWLERRHSSRWRRRAQVDVDVIDDESMNAEREALENPDAVRAMHEALRQEALTAGDDVEVVDAIVIEDDA
jgi:hypothetical protein